MSETEVDGVDLIEAEDMFRSLSGFEQIAVEQHFRMRIAALAEDEFLLMRALLFVDAKREGMADTDAFRNVMLLRLDAVTDRFVRPDAAAVDDEDPSLREEQDREYAEFVVGVGLSFTPEQFRGLTLGQRAAIIAAANRRR